MGSRGLLDSFSDEVGLGTDQSWMKRDSENEIMVQTSLVIGLCAELFLVYPRLVFACILLPSFTVI
jgi:hypothetical protein